MSEDGLSTKGEMFHSYEGWDIPENWDVACKCLEGPKLMYKDGYYYLTTAEGGTVGTATSHMAISARSKSPTGPWENSPYNPIVHTYYKNEKWHAKGHGTLIEDKDKKWWIVYHAYQNGFYTLGRQTLMEPIEWNPDGWFTVPSIIKTDMPIRKMQGENTGKRLTLSDGFTDEKFGIQWSFFKVYDSSRVEINNGTLHFKAEGDSPGNSTPLLCIPSDESYEIQVKYELTGNAMGGLVLFYDQSMYAGLVTNGENITIYRIAKPIDSGRNEMGRSGYLKIRNIENTIIFYYSSNGEKWRKSEHSWTRRIKYPVCAGTN